MDGSSLLSGKEPIITSGSPFGPENEGDPSSFRREGREGVTLSQFPLVNFVSNLF